MYVYIYSSFLSSSIYTDPEASWCWDFEPSTRLLFDLICTVGSKLNSFSDLEEICGSLFGYDKRPCGSCRVKPHW